MLIFTLNLILTIDIFLISLCYEFSQSECFLPGGARPGLEVPRPLVQEPITTLPVTNVTTSVVHTTLDGALHLFVATTNGSLLQVS